MGKTVNPAWIQGHYKLIDRTTDTSVASWVFKAQDTAWTQTSVATEIGVVIGWGESAGQTTSTSSGTITLQYRINSGSWVTVGAATAVKYANSAAITDAGTYGTAYTTAPTGVAAFSGTGEYDENNSVGAQTPVDTYYEALFALSLDLTQLATNDLVEFRLLMGGVVFTSVDAVPTLTVKDYNAYTLTAASGTYSISGQPATILKSKLLTAASGSYSIAGQDATITYTAPPTGYTIVADYGTYSISGQPASILKGNVLTAGSGSYSISGQDASILKGNVLSAASGSYSIAGQDATITYTGTTPAYTLTADYGTYAITGQDATITYTPYVAPPSTGCTFTVYDADGTQYIVSTTVVDSDGTTYDVSTTVYDADGTPYEVGICTGTGELGGNSINGHRRPRKKYLVDDKLVNLYPEEFLEITRTALQEMERLNYEAKKRDRLSKKLLQEVEPKLHEPEVSTKVNVQEIVNEVLAEIKKKAPKPKAKIQKPKVEDYDDSEEIEMFMKFLREL